MSQDYPFPLKVYAYIWCREVMLVQIYICMCIYVYIYIYIYMYIYISLPHGRKTQLIPVDNSTG